MDIQKVLTENRLDLHMRAEDAPHAWYAKMEFEAESLCDQFEQPIYFAFNCQEIVQAYAIHESRLVVVTAGLFDFLCKLAGRVVAQGLFVAVGQRPLAPLWQPTLQRSAKNPRDLVLEPFDIVSPPWAGDTEREGLFFYLLLILFRFVVLHEIGHIYHRHGERLGSARVNVDIDLMQPKLMSIKDALDSQARELVADKLAADVLLKLQEEELERIVKTEITRPLYEKLLYTRQKRIEFLSHAIYLYFSATDRASDLSPHDAIRMSHPPAAFRYVTIGAAIKEVLSREFGEDESKKIISSISIVGDALLAVALDRVPSREWLAKMKSRVYIRHYKKIYPILNRWTCWHYEVVTNK